MVPLIHFLVRRSSPRRWSTRTRFYDGLAGASSDISQGAMTERWGFRHVLRENANAEIIVRWL